MSIAQTAKAVTSYPTTTAVVALGVRRRLFTADHRLVVPPRPAE